MRASDLLDRLVAEVVGLEGPRLVVAVDGPDAAGKTTLADRLATRLGTATTLDVRRCSLDDFHAPAQVRHRRGELSHEGYYRDTFDLLALRGRVLDPFLRQDPRTRAVLVVDGVFLHRRELRERWDLGVYLHVSEETVVARARRRDVDLFGSEEEVRRRYREKYLPGQRLYREEVRPLETVDVVVQNERPERPEVLRWVVRSQPTSE